MHENKVPVSSKTQSCTLRFTRASADVQDCTSHSLGQNGNAETLIFLLGFLVRIYLESSDKLHRSSYMRNCANAGSTASRGQACPSAKTLSSLGSLMHLPPNVYSCSMQPGKEGSMRVPTSAGSSCQKRWEQAQTALHWSGFFSSFALYPVALCTSVSRLSAVNTRQRCSTPTMLCRAVTSALLSGMASSYSMKAYSIQQATVSILSCAWMLCS